MNKSRHSGGHGHGHGHGDFDDLSSELNLSSMKRDELNPNDLGASLDLDRHISTQRPTRESILRAVRGEDDDDDNLGESFAVDENSPFGGGSSSHLGGYHPHSNQEARRASNLVPVMDVEGEEEENDDGATGGASSTDAPGSGKNEPALIVEAQKAS